jgi:ABC-type uncharacterized transport system permease subunit
MGKATGATMLGGLMAQLGWVLLMYVVARFVWQRGIKKYSAFGG